ncbi:MAG TPA: hypothetical protein VKB16_09945 [Beijerinckiaceae bacterium]|nr:hypothetical protein [Beijerinckiaceae bacterium]
MTAVEGDDDAPKTPTMMRIIPTMTGVGRTALRRRSGSPKLIPSRF